MKLVEQLSAKERNDLFQYVAGKKKIDNVVVIEKDFWICWVLSKIFSDNTLKQELHFKGGTSLSKIFNVIERFSEDIDLILNWDVLDNDDNINENRSVNQQDKVNKKIESAAEKYISTSLKYDINASKYEVCCFKSYFPLLICK